MKSNSKKEIEGREQILRIVDAYSPLIEPWIFTAQIEIDENVIPFSHPILTLNCNYLNSDVKQLSNFLHEQFHWFVERKQRQKQDAIRDFMKIFDQVPVSGKLGARDEESTYLHLVVCDLEFQAMTKLIGEQAARQVLQEWSHYTWIYDKILHDKRIRAINNKYKFVIP